MDELSEILVNQARKLVSVVELKGWSVVLALEDGEWKVESLQQLINCEVVVRSDAKVQALAKEVGAELHQIFADGWAIGWDDRFPKGQRLQQALLFARFSQHDNLYAHPLDFVPVIDSLARKVVHIDFPPSWKKKSGGDVELPVSTTQPQSLSDESFSVANRARIPPPLTTHDFLHCTVVQPEGVSFKMKGHVLEWQKWKMHVEVLYCPPSPTTTTGQLRPILYRLSIVEMAVPYGNSAFDSGEYGMGSLANELSLGCDCLGENPLLGAIAFCTVPGAYVTLVQPLLIKNAICIHEEDAGVLWKHSDFRPGGRSRTVRSRRLVVSMVCTAANYEYIWNYYFYQDGNIEIEIRLTGILQVYVAGLDEPTPYGTTVAPGINAHYHQHTFSVRVDPMLDGLQNSVIESEIVGLDAPTGSNENFAGNGFVIKDRILKSQVEDGARDFNWASERLSYAIMMKGAVLPLLEKPDSWIARRASFAHKQLWVVRDEEGPKGSRIFPSGKYVPQTREEPEDSVGKWVKEGNGSIENEDIVLFLTLGTTHIPRPEGWPVMPVEHVGVLFKPSSFFTSNPSMDVPGIKDSQSRPVFNTNNANGQHTNVFDGTACCAN
ncbi:copper amine oxidase [Pisolithus sp. B1]|nr:copper amine oxidase [Pisolithus sp. B1]